MKQRGLTILILAAMAVNVLIAASSHASEHVGKVLAIMRDVYKISEAVTEKAEPDMGLGVKDEVATGKKSRARLQFMNTSDASLTEMTRLIIEDWIYGSGEDRSRAIFKLDEGALRMIVRGADVEVHTEAAVADAKGTAFVIWTEKIRKDDVEAPVERTCSMTLEGSVEFRVRKTAAGGRDRVTIGEGMMSCIEGNVIEEPRLIESGMKRYWSRQFPVLMSVVSFDRELVGFIPVSVVTVDIEMVELPDIDQEPVQTPAANVNPQILFQAP